MVHISYSQNTCFPVLNLDEIVKKPGVWKTRNPAGCALNVLIDEQVS